MKPKLFLCLALVLGGFFEIAQADESLTNSEPRYLDKSLSEWIPLGRSLGGDVLSPIDWRSFEAVREMGTKAIPWLLRWVRSRDPATAALGIEGLGMLGPSGRAAVPELIQLVNDWKSSSAWSNAIPALAAIRDSNYISCAFNFFLSEATNTAAPPELRSCVIESLTQMGFHINGTGFLLQLGTNASLAIPVFVHCLQDKDWRVASAAANALGVYTIEPRKVVPALATCLASRANASETAVTRSDWHGDIVVRARAVGALRMYANVETWSGFPNTQPPQSFSASEYRQAMREAVPELVQVLHDKQWWIASAAAATLSEAALEPDLVIPALTKCLSSPRHELRYAATEALGNFGAAANLAVPALLQAQESDTNRDVVWAAASALKKIVPSLDACDPVINAINSQDWKALRRLAADTAKANLYIANWEKFPVRVGNLVDVDKNFNLNSIPCMLYSFRLSLKDGGNYPHLLQIIVRRDKDKSSIMDFWEFGW